MQHMGNVVEIGIGAFRQAARKHHAYRFQARKPGLLVEAFARRECPVRHEYALHVDHDRSLDLEVQALRRSGGLQRKPMAFANVHAADKAETPVDDEDLAMIAQVGIAQARQTCRQECGRSNPFACKQPQHGRPAVPGTHVVDQDPHLDPAVLGSDQGLQESLSGAVIVEDICQQADRPSRTFDRSEHRGKRDVAILERVNLIPRDQRASGDGLADTRKRCKGWRHAGVRIPPARQFG
jgi:hypothetical protein